ncbi:ATP-binding protein [Kitasatospora kifunensis]|uniref:Anti-sigma regulatory factor (Ser/Thr protein kinase) n=1 Tax=Kitasatospora kifunensis TaxID=58351 RepID=A0A7W7VWG2_KITKI|nr:ATP-binding protein [Kitasatospora kifunensis]MBB4924943.1 anti-sigma regulatory factor (Ser/Thr protein kinase) [Kitasatospora kifunensis]
MPVPPLSAEHHFRRTAQSVSRSRNLFRQQATSWSLAEDTVDTAALLLSELMTNACRHARFPRDRYIAARWIIDPASSLLRVEVSDADRRLPSPRHTNPDDESGRGLELLAALAAAWGAHPRPCGIGKTVWFELKLLP